MLPPSLVLVTGHPATGKTTLARGLAGHLGWPVLTKDDIKERLFDTLGWGTRAWSQQLGVATYALLYYFMELELGAGHSLIVESNFRPASANAELQALQNKHPFRPFQVVCHADGPIILRRYEERAAAGTRHPGHVDHLVMPELAAQVAAIGPMHLDLDGPVCNVDTSDLATLDYAGLFASIAQAVAEP